MDLVNTAPETAPSTAWDREKFLRLTDYREVEEVLRRGRDFVVQGTRAGSEEFAHGTLVSIDGREHLDQRRALARMIGPEQPWGAQGSLIDEIVAHNLNNLRETSAPKGGYLSFDLIEFGRRIVWKVTAAFVGLDGIDDDETVAQFQALAFTVFEGFNVEQYPEERHPEILAAARGASQRIREDLFAPSLDRRMKLVEASRGQASGQDAPPADLITSMLLADGDQPPDPDRIFRVMVMLLAGSINNPVNQTAYALNDLLPWLEAHPECSPQTEDREFLNRAFKETVRLHRSARPHVNRIAVDDTVLETSGRPIAKGQWVSCWLQAANRDPAVFGQDADSYDPFRKPLDPKVPPFGVAFGAGPHTCLGRPLVLWEQGSSEAQGMVIKFMRLLLSEGARPDPAGIQQEDGPEGGRRFTRYDILIRA